jgi:hypothetical protein
VVVPHRVRREMGRPRGGLRRREIALDRVLREIVLDRVRRGTVKFQSGRRWKATVAERI